MENIYNLVVETFREGMKIPLIRKGKYYTFIETSTTRVNGVFYDKAIHYRISDINTKKITSLFIELTCKYYIEENTFPSRNWYETHKVLKYEYKSRLCNCSVAQGLIKKVLEK